MRRLTYILYIVTVVGLMTGCSTHKNTAQSRFWQSFTAKYNTYYNGSLAFIDGNLEKEKSNKDNYTERLPLYPVSNKQSREIGRGNYDRAIEKMEKTIKLHSIKARPEWNKSRRKTAKDREWLGRKEYNPFLWKAWMMLGKAQFQKAAFDEAAATFAYVSRLYQTQPMQNSLARAWLAKCYTELDWLYDAEDVIRNMSRDSIHYRSVRDWDATYANYYLRTGELEKAAPYLRRVIKSERRNTQKARLWYIMGQVETALGHRDAAYKAYGHTVRLNPPYELVFNARIAQTEVMGESNARGMISKLKRMAANDNNKDYLDQVYYAIGNIYLAQKDTMKAIGAYEKGNEKATRSGIEHGVLLLHLGDLYWTLEKYNDAQRCYGAAIGMLDKDRPDYEELSQRSKVLDELVPYTDAVHLQDSLQQLAKMDEKDRNAAIDRVIEALKKKEKEERDKAQEAEVEKQLQQRGTAGNRNNVNTPQRQTPQMGGNNGQWYFYNQQTITQGKQAFQRQWGKRENVDDWQRVNQTVVGNLAMQENSNNQDNPEISDSTAVGSEIADSLTNASEIAIDDSAANDPHKRDYYLVQIPFTEEQVAESDNIIKDGLFHAGVIFKDKLENMKLAEKQLLRLANNYADFEKMDEVWYHLYLLYARLGKTETADNCLSHLTAEHPESQWTILLSDPYFEENARFGQHIEDSLYAATYEAFKADRYEEVKGNAHVSADRFPLGENRPKFLFVHGLSLLNEGDAKGCLTQMKEVVEKYPKSEVTEMAGMIVKGVQAGRPLHGGKFDLGDVWSRRDVALAADSATTDTLSAERNTDFLFIIAYEADSVNENQLLFEMARYNFTNFMVRNFELDIEKEGYVHRMLVSGFMNYDEALQYARRLHGDDAMRPHLRHTRSLIISQQNLKLIGTHFSYNDYDDFYEKTFAPLNISDEQLLTIPGQVTPIDPEDIPENVEQPDESDEQDYPDFDDDLF